MHVCVCVRGGVHVRVVLSKRPFLRQVCVEVLWHVYVCDCTVCST